MDIVEGRKRSPQEVINNEESSIPFAYEPNGVRFNIFESNLRYINENFGNNIELVVHENGDTSKITTVECETDLIPTSDTGVNTEKSSLSNKDVQVQTEGSSIWPIAVPIPFFLFYNKSTDSSSTPTENMQS